MDLEETETKVVVGVAVVVQAVEVKTKEETPVAEETKQILDKKMLQW